MIEIEDLKKVKLSKDDVLIFQLSKEEYYYPSKDLRKHFREFFDSIRRELNIPFMVVPSSMKLSVITRDEAEMVCQELEMFDPKNLDS